MVFDHKTAEGVGHMSTSTQKDTSDDGAKMATEVIVTLVVLGVVLGVAVAAAAAAALVVFYRKRQNRTRGAAGQQQLPGQPDSTNHQGPLQITSTCT